MSKIKKFIGKIIVAILLAATKAHAMNLYTYDLDSLVYMSPQIVEGEFVSGSYATDNVEVMDMKTSDVYKGNLKAGQTIKVTALDFFRVSTTGFWGNDSLKKGDQLFLFFDRAQNTFLYNIPASAEVYWPAPSGVHLIIGDKVLEFSQWMNPGPYVAILEGAETNAAIPTTAMFREQIRESIPRVEKWKPVLDDEPTTNDIPALLEILREERKRRCSGPNSITEIACRHLAALHDISALMNALEINNTLSWALGVGFDSTEGRNFIWLKIANKNQPMEERIKWANFLSEAGKGSPAEHQLKRIAELAALDGQDRTLQESLLDSIRQLENRNRFTGGSNDLSEAAPILESLSERSESQEVKHDIDLILGTGQGVTSILTIRSYGPSARHLSYNYDIIVSEANLTAKIAFTNTKTGQKWSLPADLALNAGEQMGGIKDVDLPKDLPSGHYHVAYDFFQDGKIVCSSRFFDANF